MKKKVLYLLPSVILAVITWIWLFYKDGRWYTYHLEWPCIPLMILHMLLPLFYAVMFVVWLIRHLNKKTRKESDIYYLLVSVGLTVACTIGLLAFLMFTSGM